MDLKLGSAGAPAFLGTGVFRPLRRDEKNDFASGSGVDLIKASIGQILGTRARDGNQGGELKWRGNFGSLLHKLKHKKMTPGIEELARTYVINALARWEPRIALKRVEFYTATSGDLRGRVLYCRIVFHIINRNVPGNRVYLAEDVTYDVPLAA